LILITREFEVEAIFRQDSFFMFANKNNVEENCFIEMNLKKKIFLSSNITFHICNSYIEDVICKKEVGKFVAF